MGPFSSHEIRFVDRWEEFFQFEIITIFGNIIRFYYCSTTTVKIVYNIK